jgi:hypothetical protein
MNLNLVAEVSAEAVALSQFHTLPSLLTLMLIAAICAAFSLFLDYFLEDHPLGQWYLCQLQKLPTLWSKPLGECPFCSGAWQYLIISFFMFDYPIYLCLIFLGANHMSLLLLNKWQKKLLFKNKLAEYVTPE